MYMTVGRATPEMKIFIFLEIVMRSWKVNRENPIAVIPAKTGNAASFRLLLAFGKRRMRKMYMLMKIKNGARAKRLGLPL